MFTGIVETQGKIVSLTGTSDAARVVIDSPQILTGVAPGDSVAVNGCCLTVVEHDGSRWRADVMRSTLDATALGDLQPDDFVNLERAVRVDARLGGHIVQGHVDGVGTVLSREPAEHWDVVEVEVPESLTRYIVAKGSIALDGVSLTVVQIEGQTVTVSLIPETLSRTAWGRKAVGEKVNIEVDILAKYVESLLSDGQVSK